MNRPSPVGNSREGTSWSGLRCASASHKAGMDALALADANRVERTALLQRLRVRSRGMAAYGNEDCRIDLLDFGGKLQCGGGVQNVQA